MGRKRKPEPLVSTDAGRQKIDHGIYASESFTTVEAMLEAAAKTDGMPRDLVGQVQWLAQQIEQMGKLGDEEMQHYAAEAVGAIGSFLSAKPSDRDARLVLLGVWIGRLRERLEVLPHQWAALSGKRQAKRNAKIAKEGELTEHQLQERYQAVQDELAAQARRHRRINREKAYEVVAEKMQLSKSTIKQSFIAFGRRSR